MEQGFAQLIPVNVAAVQCFHTVWNAVQRHPQDYTHHKNFLVRTGEKIKLRDALRQESGTAAETSFSELSVSSEATEADDDPLDELVWSGYYSFRFRPRPALRHVGWRAGYGRKWATDPTGRVDLLLALADDAKSRHVHGNHGIFNFIQPSAAFAVKAVHQDAMTIVGSDHLRSADNFRALTDVKTIMSFGDLQYLFQYSIDPSEEQEYRNRKREYIVEALDQPAPIASVSAFPSDVDIHIGKWTLLMVAGAGTESIVRSAMAIDGQLAAVKRLVRRGSNDSTARLILLWKDLERRLESVADNQYALRLIDVVSTGPTVPCDEYVLCSPLARQSLRELLDRTGDADLLLDDNGSTLSHKQAISLFIQCARGLSAIHQAGFVHRDVKPANFGVVSFNPLRLVIFDYGHVVDVSADRTNGVRARPVSGGTIGFIAPEREAADSSYGQPADIWALGCMGLQIFFPPYRRQIPWQVDFNPWRDPRTLPDGHDDPQGLMAQHAAICLDLEYNKKTPLANLIRSMLYTTPGRRPSIASVIDSLKELE